MELYKVVGMDGEVLETNVTLHPGEVLGEELDAREILKKDFAGALGIKTQYLRDIVKGKKNVTDRMALKLEKELGIEAGFWLRLQIAYALFNAKKELQET
jgi:antitoxin HigA-1